MKCIEKKKNKGNEKENGTKNVVLETLGSEKRDHFTKETEVREVELQGEVEKKTAL